MGLFRLLILLAIAWLAYRLFRGWQRTLQQPKAKPHKRVETVVRCHICQLHIPETEALEKNGRYYCSQQHLQQDPEN